jgi:hypothetical protein
LDILRAAYGAAAIALAAAALVILFSSRSFVLTLFAVFTIAFILTSVTSMLVASGWTLGFLESICFAIAIGISCDFVIHFAHAYSSLEGGENRSERTKYSLIRMGPSILAAAFTTVCSATVMIFTTISFFQKFAVILFFTILMATVGSFVVFITLTDCIGPSKPTYLMDLIIAKMTDCCCKRCKKSKANEETDESSAAVSFSRGLVVASQASVIDGRRTSLYSDLDSLKASRQVDPSIDGRRSSLYSDLESLSQSTNTVNTVEEGRSSLYADLENL